MPSLIRPYEVTTVVKGSRLRICRYVVIATSTTHAMNSIELEDSEEIVHAKEMVDHKLVIGK